VYFGDDFSGEYLFTVTDPKNDNVNQWSQDDTSALIEEINNRIDPDISKLDPLGKYDVDTDAFEGLEFAFFDNGDLKSGTWNTGGTQIESYTVKGANEWALYWLYGGASEGKWSTEHLSTPNGKNIPELSHLTLWNSDQNAAPVPEPSTIVLLGVGLMGILGAGRKLKK
ncbi:MAG: PEP-CTERM sorting domain-containing protein, partial [Thermodesulfobacteriota bacterium]